jgi:hypothetical protein
MVIKHCVDLFSCFNQPFFPVLGRSCHYLGLVSINNRTGVMLGIFLIVWAGFGHLNLLFVFVMLLPL